MSEAFKQFTMYQPMQTITTSATKSDCTFDETETWECVCDNIGRYGERITVHVMECSECGRTHEHVNGGYEYCPHCGRIASDDEKREPDPRVEVIRCRDCAKTDRSPDGLVCKRFGAFYHLTPEDGYCHEGEPCAT